MLIKIVKTKIKNPNKTLRLKLNK